MATLRQSVQNLIGLGDRLFAQRSGLMSMWQEIAEHFYPEKADFTSTRNLGADLASHLFDSYPLLCRRELANSFSSMLRPVGRQWFKLRAEDDDLNKDVEVQRWLDWAGKRVNKVMYEPLAHWVRASKEADHDFAAFGQAVIQISWRRDMRGLLYRSWHLRDVVWCENDELQIDHLHRRWKTTATDAYARWPDKIPSALKTRMEKDPYCEVQMRHIIVPSDQYEAMAKDERRWQRKKRRLTSLIIDIDNQVVLEEIGVDELGYIVPRWQTLQSSQYAFSPATVAALPNSRLLQRMALTLLEAGEKAVDPPMVAAAEVIQGGIDISAGGVTYVDSEYDERLGAALQVLNKDVGRGLSFGKDEIAATREIVNHAFFLNKINLPEPTREMTAFEISKRMDEYVRGALPLFEPAEVSFNGGACEGTMAMLLKANAFGRPDTLPRALQGRDVRFVYESPLQQATDRAKAEAFNESMGLLKTVAEVEQLGPINPIIKISEALRDALGGIGAPPTWVASQEEEDQANMQRQAAQAQATAAQQSQQQAELGQQVGDAAQSLQGAGILPANPMSMMAGGADPHMVNALVPQLDPNKQPVPAADQGNAAAPAQAA